MKLLLAKPPPHHVFGPSVASRLVGQRVTEPGGGTVGTVVEAWIENGNVMADVDFAPEMEAILAPPPEVFASDFEEEAPPPFVAPKKKGKKKATPEDAGQLPLM